MKAQPNPLTQPGPSHEPHQQVHRKLNFVKDTGGDSSGTPQSESGESSGYSDRSSDLDYTVSDHGRDSYDSDDDDNQEDEAGDPVDLATQTVNCRKYLVFEDELRDLLAQVRCKECNKVLLLPKSTESLGTEEASALKVKVQCINGHQFTWASQPTLGEGSAGVYAGSLLIAASILFSGGNFAKVAHFASILKMNFISKSTFFRHQGNYLIPAIHDAWNAKQEEHWHDIRARGTLRVSGDGRCDSPGYSAKFCTYSVMDMETDKIVDTETVVVTETKNSNAMEKEACRRVLDRLESELPVSVLCTDRHMGIQKMMREDYSNMTHQYDVWHLAKSIAKRLIQKARKKGVEDLLPWVPCIKTHLWWSAATCQGNEMELIEKWQSVTYHVTNQHDWHTGQHFTKCAHDPLSAAEVEETKWLEPESPAHVALNKVLEDKQLLDGVKKLNQFCHTGKLENFNGFLTKYAPKRIAFSHEGMIARTKLACMDHNANVGRLQAVDSTSGESLFDVAYSKATGKYSSRPVYESKEYSFLDDMMKDVIDRKLGQRKKECASFKLPALAKNIAPKSLPRPTKEELVASYQSRFGSTQQAGKGEDESEDV